MRTRLVPLTRLASVMKMEQLTRTSQMLAMSWMEMSRLILPWMVTAQMVLLNLSPAINGTRREELDHYQRL